MGAGEYCPAPNNIRGVVRRRGERRRNGYKDRHRNHQRRDLQCNSDRAGIGTAFVFSIVVVDTFAVAIAVDAVDAALCLVLGRPWVLKIT